MMQAAEPGLRYNFASWSRILSRVATTGRFLGQSEMRSTFVVLPDVVVHEAFQMPLIENDDVVEQVAAAVSYPPSRNTILP